MSGLPVDNPCGIRAFPQVMWENQSGPRGAGNTAEGLTDRSLLRKEAMAVDESIQPEPEPLIFVASALADIDRARQHLALADGATFPEWQAYEAAKRLRRALAAVEHVAEIGGAL